MKGGEPHLLPTCVAEPPDNTGGGVAGVEGVAELPPEPAPTGVVSCTGVKGVNLRFAQVQLLP